jgi:hypothetical protein
MRRLAPRWVSVLGLCALLGSCGTATRLAYETADTTLLISAHRYLDLAGEQWKVAREAIQRFHAWHRRAELPRYAALLQSAAGRFRRGLIRDDVEWAIASMRAHYADAIGAAAAEVAPLLNTLNARNIAQLQRRFEADDRKHTRALAGDHRKRDRARAHVIAKRLEEWTGPLSNEQQERIRRFARETSDYPRRAHEHRQRKQRELLTLLAPRGDSARKPPSADSLRSFFLSWEAERPVWERNYHARFVQLILDLDRTLTAGQRAHVIERLRAYREDVQWLSRRG